jgi:mannose-6-phosphate isomerase-like protein (cupin superfamily)
MPVRRVATGHTPDGQATIASDSDVEAITLETLPGLEFHRLWGADETVILPDDGSPPSFPAYFPPVNGFRFGLFTVPPMSEATREDFDAEAAFRELEEKVSGLAEHMEPDNPGMHTTDTIDFEYVISGEVWLEVDNGEAVHLKAGDTVVQSGTRHAWCNKSSEPCRMVVCLIGAKRR